MRQRPGSPDLGRESRRWRAVARVRRCEIHIERCICTRVYASQLKNGRLCRRERHLAARKVAQGNEITARWLPNRTDGEAKVRTKIGDTGAIICVERRCLRVHRPRWSDKREKSGQYGEKTCKRHKTAGRRTDEVEAPTTAGTESYANMIRDSLKHGLRNAML